MWFLRSWPLLVILAGATPAMAQSAAEGIEALPVVGPDAELPPGAAPQYQLGRSLLQQQDVEGALRYLNRAYRLAPRVERIALTYLDALDAGGYFRDALEIAASLVAEHPHEPSYRRRHAVYLAQAGRYRQALDDLKILHEIGVDDLDLVKLEMDVTESLGDTKAALAIGERAQSRFPDHAEALTLMQLGALQRGGQTKAMVELLQTRLASLPESSALRLALLRTLIEGGDLAEARAVARTGDARPVPPNAEAPGYSLQLAEMLGRQGKFAEAADVLEELHAGGQAPLDAQLWLARLQIGLDRPDDALALLPAVVSQWPESGEAHYLWGKALIRAGDPSAALEHLRRGVELEPQRADLRVTLLQNLVLQYRASISSRSASAGDRAIRADVEEHARAAELLVSADDPTGQLILGYTYRALGDIQRAADHFALAATSNDVEVQASLELAFCLQELGETDKATTTLEDLYRKYSDDPEVANSLGYFLAEQKHDLDRAEKLVEQALATAPANGAYLDSLGWVYFQRGEAARAFDVLVDAANEKPDDPVILEHLGLVLKSLGRTSEALDMLRRSLAAGGDPERLQPLIQTLERDGH